MADETVNIRLQILADKSLKSIKDMREEAKLLNQAMSDPNIGKAQFDALSQRLGELKNDTQDVNKAMRAMDPGELLGGFTKMAQGAVGSFAAVTSAVSLFGVENEQLQEIEKKGMQIIQLMMGLESARQLLIDNGARKENAAYLKSFGNQIKKAFGYTVETAAVSANTVAQGANAAATNVVTAATWKWNASLLANPAVAITAAILALAAGIYFLVNATDDSTEATEKNIEAEEKRKEAIANLEKQYTDFSTKYTAELQYQKDLAEAKGASDEILYQKELDIINGKIGAAKVFNQSTIELERERTLIVEKETTRRREVEKKEEEKRKQNLEKRREVEKKEEEKRKQNLEKRLEYERNIIKELNKLDIEYDNLRLQQSLIGLNDLESIKDKEIEIIKKGFDNQREEAKKTREEDMMARDIYGRYINKEADVNAMYLSKLKNIELQESIAIGEKEIAYEKERLSEFQKLRLSYSEGIIENSENLLNVIQYDQNVLTEKYKSDIKIRELLDKYYNQQKVLVANEAELNIEELRLRGLTKYNESYETELKILELQKAKELELAKESAEQKLLIEAAYEKEKKDLKEKYYKESKELALDQVQAIADASMQILQNQADHRNEVEEYQRNEKYDKEVEAVNNLAEAELITTEEKEKRLKIIEDRKAEEERKAKERIWKAEKQAALIEVAIQTAVAIMKAAPVVPLQIATGIAGGLQAAVIQSQQMPIFEFGGLIGGRKHAQGGTLINAEEGEVIINAQSAQMFRQQLSAINQAGGGVPIPPSSLSNNVNSGMSMASIDESVIETIVSRIASIPVVISETEMTKTQRRVKTYESNSSY